MEVCGTGVYGIRQIVVQENAMFFVSDLRSSSKLDVNDTDPM